MLVLAALLAAFAQSSSAQAAVKVLYIGDSHSAGTFGHQMDEKLRTIEESTVETYASCGSAANSWFTGWVTHCGYFEHTDTSRIDIYPSNNKTPLITNLLGHLKPDWTVIALGSNQILGNGDYGVESVRQLIKTVRDSGSQCAWIGPPHSRVFPEKRLQGFYDTVSSAAADLDCFLIDSRPDSPYPKTGGDGMHFDSAPGGRQIAIRWAGAVFAQLAQLIVTQPE